MPQRVRLLSTDFDGTLVGDCDSAFLHEELSDALSYLQSHGVIWAINTGRTIEQLEYGLADFTVRPDYALTSEREVFQPSAKGGWEDFGEWNTKCRRDHDLLHAYSEPLMRKLTQFVDDETCARTVHMGPYPVGIIAPSETEIDRIASFIDARREDFPMFHYQRNSVYLRFCHVNYHKGGALGELCRLLDIPRAETFAIGDNLNDLAMLDGVFAAHVACPSNSLELVKRAVRDANGYVASKPDAEGTLEALRRLFPELPCNTQKV